MAIDVVRLIGAVTREISSREKDGAPARVLVATRIYDTSMEDLWDQALLGLDRHFTSGVKLSPQEAMAWLASGEGRSFVQRSSEAWCNASIEAGAEPASARAAAQRTTAAYTGDARGSVDA